MAVTHIATSDPHSITVRGKDLVNDLMGQRTFTEMLYFLVCGKLPTQAQTAVLDVCLVTLMEHGWTPTSLITRLAFDSVPNQSQVAIAAGLLSVGPVFAGTMEGCAELLLAGTQSSEDPATYCANVAAHYHRTRQTLPGFGHRLHKPDDPRSPVILNVLGDNGLAGRYVQMLHTLSQAVDQEYGKHLTINATGAIAAALLEIGVPISAMRGVAVVSRAGGLLGHVVEEQNQPAAREIWRLARENVPYQEPEQ